MTNTTAMPQVPKRRVFLFLQGPHGPFFSLLAQRLTQTGARCYRVAFNAGDVANWHDPSHLFAFRAPIADWPEHLHGWITKTGATDLVLYGDMRRHHADAVKIGASAGLTVHVFEEGYLRPYWATYERMGSNGNSRLLQITLAKMQSALSQTADAPPLPPDRWGDLRLHMLHGALYHWHILFRNTGFSQYHAHRGIAVSTEFWLHAKRLLRQPCHRIARQIITRRIRSAGAPYHVVLLQLEHDASFRAFSDFASQTEFINMVIGGFATGAPADHRLVFKAHPLEDGRAPLAHTIRVQARAHGLQNRVSFVHGGKLAYLLDGAASAVTVNSTSAHQALWRGVPVRSFGRSVYDKPGLVSQQKIADFFAHPIPPDPVAYAVFRRFLLRTSQFPGGFYSAKARTALLGHVIAPMLAPDDPYEAILTAPGSAPQQMRHDP